ncbi:Alpha-1,3-mannosyltransferase cmt1, partial [Sarracenia purpurea var. burkii]
MGRGVKRENEQNSLPSPKSSPTTKKTKRLPEDDDARFEGKPIPAEEARERWPERYRSKRNVKLIATSSESNGVKSDEKEILQARSHYTQAVVDGCLFNLFDDAYVK